MLSSHNCAIVDRRRSVPNHSAVTVSGKKPGCSAPNQMRLDRKTVEAALTCAASRELMPQPFPAVQQLLTSAPFRIPPGLRNTEIKARIRHLSESKEATRECAATTARASAAENTTAQELFRRKIPKGWPLKRYQHGAN